MSRVLVTGASGYIGRHTVAALSAAGHEVHGVFRRRPLDAAHAVPYAVDLFEPEAVARLLDEVRPTQLLHLAWDVTGAYANAAANLDWVGASLSLLRRFAEAGGQRALLAGSCAEYDWSHARCDARLTPTAPATLYGTAKLALSQLAQRYAREVGLQLCWARLFFSYGPYEAPERLVPAVIRALVRGEPARCTHGRQRRDYLHVADLARALGLLLAGDCEGPVNVSSGEPVALREIVEELGRALGRSDLIELGALAAPPSEPAELYGVPEELHGLGWRPQVGLAQGLRETIHWWRGQLGSGRS